MIENIILGIVQGITEWLPISSDGFIILIKENFFGGGELVDLLHMALFLHLGTLLAAIIYLRKDVALLFKTLFHYRSSTEENKKLLVFIVITTIISGFLGFALNAILANITGEFISSTFVNILVAVMLLITGFMQIQAKRNSKDVVLRDVIDTKEKDRFILGVAQGFSVLPGLSRSGLTVSLLLLQRFKEETALRLSFLMSIPIVLGGNLAINFGQLDVTWEMWIGVLMAFIFGYLTIDAMFKLAKKIDFGKFVVGFGVFVLIAVAIDLWLK